MRVLLDFRGILRRGLYFDHAHLVDEAVGHDRIAVRTHIS
jgi:hypothetical protein